MAKLYQHVFRLSKDSDNHEFICNYSVYETGIEIMEKIPYGYIVRSESGCAITYSKDMTVEHVAYGYVALVFSEDATSREAEMRKHLKALLESYATELNNMVDALSKEDALCQI